MTNLGQALLIPAFSVGARGATLASDSFTDTDGVLITAHTAGGLTWTKDGSSTNTVAPTIGANRVYPENAATLSVYTTGAVPSPHYVVGCDVVMRFDNNAASAGPVGRVIAAAGTYYHARYSTVLNAWQLYKFVGGASTQLGTDQAATLTVDQAYRCELSMIGSTISLIVGGVTLISVSDTAITAKGLAGIRWQGAGTSTIGTHIDQYQVRTA